MDLNSYVIITAARNEEKYIKKTISSITSQTILPKKWVIVSDSSTDCTEEIVNEYATKFDFIKLLRVGGSNKRTFGSKINAIRAGFQEIRDIEYDIIGNLDADVSFENNYYESLLAAFQLNPKLGIAGGVVVDFYNGRLINRTGRLNHVPGAVQLFRRECYETIGGYPSVRVGIEDTIAEVMARMKGWEVISFRELKVIHHRRTGTEGRRIFSVRFLQGEQDYFLGYHPVFEVTKCLYRIKEKPYFIGSLLWICGFFWSCIKRDKRPVSPDFIKFLRREQMHDLWTRISRH